MHEEAETSPVTARFTGPLPPPKWPMLVVEFNVAPSSWAAATAVLGVGAPSHAGGGQRCGRLGHKSARGAAVVRSRVYVVDSEEEMEEEDVR